MRMDPTLHREAAARKSRGTDARECYSAVKRVKSDHWGRTEGPGGPCADGQRKTSPCDLTLTWNPEPGADAGQPEASSEAQGQTAAAEGGLGDTVEGLRGADAGYRSAGDAELSAGRPSIRASRPRVGPRLTGA